MTMEWSQSANRTSINIEYSSRSQTVHWEERIWPQHVGIRIAYAISLVITNALVGVIPVGMVPMDAGALSRIFQLTNKDMMMTGFHGDPVMVDIPASYHSHGQTGFIISFDHTPMEEMDVPGRCRTAKVNPNGCRRNGKTAWTCLKAI